jgi:hypothetical protein
LNSKEWSENGTVLRKNGEVVYYHRDDLASGLKMGKPAGADAGSYSQLRLKDAVSRWAELYEASRFSSGDDKKTYEKRMRELEGYLDPFAAKLVDERPESNQTSKGAGSYFNKDGSRDRFMEIFQRDHINTWRQTIPGMTETDPDGTTTLSPTTVSYYERGASGRMRLLKNLYTTSYDEDSDRFVLNNNFDTHRDAFRDVMRLETPAMMQMLKFQGYVMQYEMFKPVFQGLRSGIPIVGHHLDERWNQRQGWSRLTESEQAFVNGRLEEYGASLGTVGETMARKAQNWHYMQEEKDRILGTKLLARAYDRYIERERLLALASTAGQRNIGAMRRQRLLQSYEGDLV